jgi:hypothetical protein
MTESTGETPTRGARAVGWLGLVGHAALFFWYAASGLVAPGWAVAGLLTLWLVLLFLGIRLRRSRPLLTPLVPVAAMVLWLAVVSAGDAWLDWSA